MNAVILPRAVRTSLLALLALLSLAAQAGFTPPNGDWREEAEEFRVKVVGGWVRVQRDYVFNRWQINARWNPLAFEKDAIDGSIKRIVRNEAGFDAQGDAWAFGKRALIRKQTVSVLPPGSGEGSPNGSLAGGLPVQSSPGYRWLDRTSGDWIDYDNEGKAVAYGDKNDNRVWFEYGAPGSPDAGRLVKIRDHHGRTILTHRYDGSGNVAEVKETPYDGSAGRSLQLTWNGTQLMSVTDVLGNQTSYTYEGGKLKTETDPENHTRTLTYGPTGRIQKVTEPDGGEITYQYDYDKLKRTFYLRADGPVTPAGAPTDETWYDADGRQIRHDLNGKTLTRLVQDTAAKTRSETDARGQTTITTLDDTDNPIKVQYPDGSQTSASYSPVHGQVLQETDELGTKTTYSYDSKGNLLTKTEAAGLPEQRVTEYTRDAYGQTLTETKRGGSTTLPNGNAVQTQDATLTTEYDSWGNPVHLVDAENGSLTLTYNSAGRPLTLKDPLSHTWTYSWDATDQLTGFIDPLSHGITVAYNKAGNPVRVTDAEAHVTGYAYDANDRLTRISNALNQTEIFSYDALGRLSARQDEAGNWFRILTYDPQNHLAQLTDGADNSTSYQYGFDDTDPVPSQIAFPTFTRKLTWDARYRAVQIQDQLDANMSLTTTQAYDRKGNLAGITDRNGKVASFAYDALGRLVKVTDPMNGETQFAYDARDNLLAVTDPKGNTTSYSYDRNNRRTRETRPLGGKTDYAYDAVGNLVSVTDPKGNVISYGYDAAKRRITETHTPAGQGSPARTISYRYNAANALTSYTDSQGSSASYTLDALNRKTSETQSINGKSYTIQTSYAATGQLARLTWPDGYQADYAYDGNQTLQSLTLPEGSLTNQSQRWNQPTQTQLPGGTQITRDYDALMRLTQTKAKSGGGATLMDRQLTYDPESNITSNATEYGTHNYQYDSLYRLTQADNPTLGTEKYSYDSVGNRLTDNRSDTLFTTNTWSYDVDNKLTSYASQTGAPITNTWDANGSLIKQTSSDPAHNQQYRYDAQNRLVEVQDATGNTIATYVYDPFGRRITKTIVRENGQPLATPKQTTYLYAEQGLIGEADEQGDVMKRYGWKPGSPWSTDPAFLSGRRGSVDPTSPLETFYSLNDYLGTPQKLVDRNGNPVWEGRATAFGETQVQTGNEVENNLRFPGQYDDFEKRTYYNFLRDCYEPSTGRYCQSDPIGLSGGSLSTYSYAYNAPAAYLDPDGLLLTALHAMQRGTTTREATQAGGTGNAAAAAAAATAAAGAATAATGAGAVAGGRAAAAALCTQRGRSIVAAGLQALSNAQQRAGQAIPPGLGGTAPTSQSAVINALRQSTSAAQQAAKNNPGIGRPGLPR